MGNKNYRILSIETKGTNAIQCIFRQPTSMNRNYDRYNDDNDDKGDEDDNDAVGNHLMNVNGHENGGNGYEGPNEAQIGNLNEKDHAKAVTNSKIASSHNESRKDNYHVMDDNKETHPHEKTL